MKYTTRNPGAATTFEFDTFKLALENDSAGTIIAWPDLHVSCCLDVDDINGIDPGELCHLLRPSPEFAWVSRSGKGLHAIYSSLDHYFADELAALATLQLRLHYPQLHKFELLKHTFRPPGRYIEQAPSLDTSEIDRWLGKSAFDPDAALQWLESRGMSAHGRYAHTLCPIDPNGQGGRDPVIVYDDGIYCHVCAAKHGHGWYSFGRLAGGSRRGDYALMIRHRVHWDHAKYVMRELSELNDRLNERIYSASLVHVHGNDIRDDALFIPRNIIRLARWWGNETGETYNQRIEPILASLPTAQYRDDKGKLKKRADTIARLMQTTDLTDMGYPSIYPVRGIRIYGHYQIRRDNSYTLLLHNDVLSRDENEPYRPRYVDESIRDVEAAWQLLETPFPGICRPVIELLIAARGISEGQVGLPPFLYLSGLSSTAKTSSVMIAAAIVGDANTSVVWTKDTDRIRAGIYAGKSRGSYVTINEILKEAKKANVSVQTAMDDLLNLTSDSTSHILYVGPVPMGVLPVIVWTDTEVPAEVCDSTQLARRLIHAHMSQKVDWETSLYESGVQRIEWLRRTSMEYAEACNAIVSDVIDRFFRSEQDLRAVANELGFPALTAQAGSIPHDTFREFFNAVCNAPTLDGTNAKRWSGSGWRLIDLTQSGSPLAILWDTIRDTENPKYSRACMDADWGKIIGAPHTVEFECQAWGNRVGVRFVARMSDGINRVNAEILK